MTQMAKWRGPEMCGAWHGDVDGSKPDGSKSDGDSMRGEAHPVLSEASFGCELSPLRRLSSKLYRTFGAWCDAASYSGYGSRFRLREPRSRGSRFVFRSDGVQASLSFSSLPLQDLT